METDTRRNDRWAATSRETRANAWAIVAIVVVLAAYAAAVLVAAIVKGNVDLGDDAGLALVAATPALAAFGVVLGLVARRRERLRWLAWFAIVLGGVLVIASIASIVAVALAFRTFN